jgi:hypothetical protein
VVTGYEIGWKSAANAEWQSLKVDPLTRWRMDGLEDGKPLQFKIRSLRGAACFDGLADQLRILDLTSSEQFIFPTGTGDTTTWSPDGTLFLFTDMEQDENGLRTQVRRADLTINKTDILIGAGDARDYSYSSLAWSPAGDQVVLGLRIVEDKPGESLWLFDPVILDGPMIANADETTYNAPTWNPWGSALLFQQFKLRGAFKPEVGLWTAGDIEPRLLTDGLMPHWLP